MVILKTFHPLWSLENLNMVFAPCTPDPGLLFDQLDEENWSIVSDHQTGGHSKGKTVNVVAHVTKNWYGLHRDLRKKANSYFKFSPDIWETFDCKLPRPFVIIFLRQLLIIISNHNSLSFFITTANRFVIFS